MRITNFIYKLLKTSTTSNRGNKNNWLVPKVLSLMHVGIHCPVPELPPSLLLPCITIHMLWMHDITTFHPVTFMHKCLYNPRFSFHPLFFLLLRLVELQMFKQSPQVKWRPPQILLNGNVYIAPLLIFFPFSLSSYLVQGIPLCCFLNPHPHPQPIPIYLACLAHATTLPSSPTYPPSLLLPHLTSIKKIIGLSCFSTEHRP